MWNNGSIFRARTTIHSGTFSPLKRKQMKKIKQDAWQDFTYE